MTTKHKIEMFVAILVVVALIIVLFLLWKKPAPSGGAVISAKPSTHQTASPSSTASPAASASQAPVSAEVTARVFAERFGSYSSETHFANIDDVLPLSTAKLQQQLKQEAAKAKAAVGASTYTGTSTYVLSTKVAQQTDSTATVECSTQRVVSVGTAANSTTTYQTLVLNLVKEGATWKVDEYSWQQ